MRLYKKIIKISRISTLLSCILIITGCVPSQTVQAGPKDYKINLEQLPPTIKLPYEFHTLIAKKSSKIKDKFTNDVYEIVLKTINQLPEAKNNYVKKENINLEIDFNHAALIEDIFEDKNIRYFSFDFKVKFSDIMISKFGTSQKIIKIKTQNESTFINLEELPSLFNISIFPFNNHIIINPQSILMLKIQKIIIDEINKLPKSYNWIVKDDIVLDQVKSILKISNPKNNTKDEKQSILFDVKFKNIKKYGTSQKSVTFFIED